jgi:protein-tyrosine kinase
MGKVSRALEKSQEEYSEKVGLDSVKQEPVQVAGEEQRPEVRMKDKPQPAHREAPRDISQAGLWDERLLKVAGGSSQLSESFRVLRSRILHPSDEERQLKSILVTSTAPGEGKSFVCANLAIALARGMDQFCLVVDCDLRRPTLASLLGLANDPGLSDYLQKKYSISEIIKKTSVDKLSLLSSGHPPVNPSELLGSVRMQGLVQELSSRYDDRFIIFDSPPIQAASETSVLAKQVDGVVLVVRWGASGRAHVKRLVDDIGKEKIIGVVFNGFKSNIIESKVLNYYDHYYYDYTHKKSE